MPLLALIGGLRGIVTALAASAATIALLSVYDRAIDDPAVAKAAQLVFVERAERQAAIASMAEARRQREAVDRANAGFSDTIKAREAAAESERTALEQEIADYEKRLTNAGRACLLDDADVDFLRQSKQPAKQRRK